MRTMSTVACMRSEGNMAWADGNPIRRAFSKLEGPMQ